MDREDDLFTPEAIDEQIERLRNDPQQYIFSREARLVDDLDHVYSQDANRLDHIWERLMAQTSDNPGPPPQPVDLQQYRQKRANTSRMARPPSDPHTRNRIQQVGFLLAKVVAVILITGAFIQGVQHLGNSSQAVPSSASFEGNLPHTIFMSNDAGVTSVDTLTGDENWMYHIQDYALTTPANPIAANGLVYAESQKSIYAIDEMAGSLRWSRTFAYEISPYPTNKARLVLYNNALYVSVVTANTSEVDKLDARTGKTLATYKPVLNTNIIAIAISADTLYAFGLYDMCAFNLTTHEEIWHQEMSASESLGIPHIVDGTIYTITTSDANWPYAMPHSSSSIEAFDAATGTLDWQSTPIPGTVTDITISGNLIYDGASDGSISAYNSKTGIQLWTKIIPGMSFSGIEAPIINQKTIYIATEDPSMYYATGILALNETNGDIQWQYPTSLSAMRSQGHTFDPPVLQNGLLFANDSHESQNSSELYAFIDGAIVWQSMIH